MLDPEYELKTAIYNRLTDATLGSKYDVVGSADKKQDYPYIEIGEVITSDWSTKSECGHRLAVTFHCWVRSNSSDTVSDMRKEILSSLTTSYDITPSFLSLTNYNVIRQDRMMMSSLKERGDFGEIRHGILDIDFWLQEK